MVLQKGVRILAEQLPDMAAGELHRVLPGAVALSLLLRQYHVRCPHGLPRISLYPTKRAGKRNTCRPIHVPLSAGRYWPAHFLTLSWFAATQAFATSSALLPSRSVCATSSFISAASNW